MKTIMRVRMVAARKESELTRKDGTKVPTFFFTVADRDQIARTNPDGTVSYFTKGFHFVEAIGNLAIQLKKDFDKKDANGKMISRALYIEAEPRSYKDKKEVDVDMTVPADALFPAFGVAVPAEAVGKTVTLLKKQLVEVINTVYVIKEFRYDDYPAKGTSSTSSDVTISVSDTVTDVEDYDGSYEEETAIIQ